jgi:hypothetical protein
MPGCPLLLGPYRRSRLQDADLKAMANIIPGPSNSPKLAPIPNLGAQAMQAEAPREYPAQTPALYALSRSARATASAAVRTPSLASRHASRFRTA